MPYYLNSNKRGLKEISSNGDGISLKLTWNRAYPEATGARIAYNIYMSEERPDFEFELFVNSPSFVSIDNALSATISDLTPGKTYRFGVRAFEYNTSSFDFSILPTAPNGLKFYPSTTLLTSIGPTDLNIYVVDASEFPPNGTIKIGTELINYSSINLLLNCLILNSLGQRGYNNTSVSSHLAGDSIILNPIVNEEFNTVEYAKENAFDFPNYAYTQLDGYRQTITDILNPDLEYTEQANEVFPTYDTSGYRRIDLNALINGECVGSYFGGERGCIDGYGISHRVRGLSVQDANNQREEKLLSLTGEPVVLLKKQHTGIRCRCINPQQEHPDARCVFCFGTGFEVGYFQWFNPRRSDRRIMIRFEPWTDQLPLTDSGLDVEQVKPSAWTSASPILKPRDLIIRFGQDGNEEFRYEVINITRNMMFEGQYGAQKFALTRIRKTDQIYSIPYLKDASKIPKEISTSAALSAGIPLHSHTIITNEGTPDKWEQITSISAGHSHQVKYNHDTGTLQIVDGGLGHHHTINLV